MARLSLSVERRQIMKGVVEVLVALLILSSPISTIAGEGRYQIVFGPQPRSMGPAAALILDTQDGHLWVWFRRNEIYYQGQLRPGKEMGERIGIPHVSAEEFLDRYDLEHESE